MTESEPLSSEPDRALRPPQFTLRSLLLLTLAVAVLVSVMTSIGTLWAVGVLFLMLLVSGHVLGNAVGTRLRDRAPSRAEEAGGRKRSTQGESVVRHGPSRLGQHKRLHWIHLVLAASGSLAGGYFGGAALADNYPDATPAAVWVAHISAGVLSGLAVFVLSTFATMVRQMLSEAHAGSDRHRPAGPGPLRSVGVVQPPRDE